MERIFTTSRSRKMWAIKNQTHKVPTPSPTPPSSSSDEDDSQPPTDSDDEWQPPSGEDDPFEDHLPSEEPDFEPDDHPSYGSSGSDPSEPSSDNSAPSQPPSHPSQDSFELPTVGRDIPLTKPRYFTGNRVGPTKRRPDVQYWLNKMEIYLKLKEIPYSQWPSTAFYFLDNPAFNNFRATKVQLQRENKWVGDWPQFTQIMYNLYGDVAKDMELRNRLRSLSVRNGDIGTFARIFNEVAMQISSPPLSDSQLVSDFLSQLDNTTLADAYAIDPHTNNVWATWKGLFDAVMRRDAVRKY